MSTAVRCEQSQSMAVTVNNHNAGNSVLLHQQPTCLTDIKMAPKNNKAKQTKEPEKAGAAKVKGGKCCKRPLLLQARVLIFLHHDSPEHQRTSHSL